MGKSTVFNIIFETCTALWNKLRASVLELPTTEDWKGIGRGFESQWNFPNCIGAIDGKHIPIQASAGAGSEYYNYKGFHSKVLLAICDYRYAFTMLDIEATGRQSDGGIFSRSKMRKYFEEDRMGVPNPVSVLDSDNVLHFVAVGDQAFSLTTYLMTPYSENNKLSLDQRIFNYRLSRARRIIENTFGILTAK
ncbi:putative nuclease HARBI1 [Temnothorax curvispinosus]|uniref:Nuclease HARBI1 n=1 Tax=Temnothorax curvispinosus TaxID=300111 RepID=A0A6J1PVS0_9HYME|nr:putative nuclease HARBI1 [Temnothorax curvispinosus]